LWNLLRFFYGLTKSFNKHVADKTGASLPNVGMVISGLKTNAGLKKSIIAEFRERLKTMEQAQGQGVYNASRNQPAKRQSPKKPAQPSVQPTLPPAISGSVSTVIDEAAH
jgi:hypothetical protein